MTKLVIIGAGGHGKVVADCAEKMGDYNEIVFIDDIVEHTRSVLHWPIVGASNQWQSFINEAEFIVAIGNNHTRFRLINELMQAGANIATIIHPSAQISSYAKVGRGTVIFAGAVINCSASIGLAAIINTSATIDHDCTIGDACHISPGANVAGAVTIGDRVWVGIGSAIIQCLSIGHDIQLGAGCVVTKNIDQPGVYIGAPASKI